MLQSIAVEEQEESLPKAPSHALLDLKSPVSPF
jgi:hypothetical protein